MARKDLSAVGGRKLFERFFLYLPIGLADGTGEWDFHSTACFATAIDTKARALVGEDEVLLCKLVPVAVYRRKGKRVVRTHIVGGDGK